jgi:hypothetical protein
MQHRTFDRDDVAIGEGRDWATAFIRSVAVDPGVKVDTKGGQRIQLASSGS